MKKNELKYECLDSNILPKGGEYCYFMYPWGQDYDDLGACPMADIYKSMKLVGLYPDSWDEDIREFVEFMAMR